ncbi:MAG: TolC family protein [Flavobacteriales bacterium]|nr:TolC family protein [Flavobacteriales bacterium]
MFRIYVFSFMLFFSFPGLGQAKQEIPIPSDTLDLKACLNLGLENSRSIKKALMDEESAKFYRNEVKAGGLPQISAYGNYNNFIDVFPQAVPGGLFGPGDADDVAVIALGVPQSLKAGVTVNQLIFNSSYLIGLKAARTSEEFYKTLSQQTEEQVIYDIAMNYLGVTQMELQRENLRANVDQLKGLERILEAQVANDLVRKVDLNRVKVNLSTLESEMENLETEIFRGLSYLKLIMGIPVDTPIELKKSEVNPETIANFQMTDLDPESRTDIQVLDIQKTLYDYEYKNIKATNHPSLVGFADFNRNSFSNNFDFLSESKVWYQGSLIGLKLQVPIFDGFAVKSRAAQSKIRQQQLLEDRAQALDAAQMEYNNATKKYFNALQTLRANEANLKLAEDVLKETALLYREGLSPLTDLLEAESTQRQARANFNNQLVQVRIAQLEILKSTGQITRITS